MVMEKFISVFFFVIGLFLFISGANALGNYFGGELDSLLVALFPIALSSFFVYVGKEIRKEKSK